MHINDHPVGSLKDCDSLEVGLAAGTQLALRLLQQDDLGAPRRLVCLAALVLTVPPPRLVPLPVYLHNDRSSSVVTLRPAGSTCPFGRSQQLHASQRSSTCAGLYELHPRPAIAYDIAASWPPEAARV